jgi:hypothetical protein
MHEGSWFAVKESQVAAWVADIGHWIADDMACLVLMRSNLHAAHGELDEAERGGYDVRRRGGHDRLHLVPAPQLRAADLGPTTSVGASVPR